MGGLQTILDVLFCLQINPGVVITESKFVAKWHSDYI